MKTVFVLFDSLNRKALECYGGTAVRTPNFSRLAERSVTFDAHYVGSLPCIPARRDLHTGRLNFLHRSWGPLEPFDDSFPQILRENGIYTHIVTDHHHYFADGGATYHQRYSSWELFRGQAIDRWKPMVRPPMEALREDYHPMQHHRVNYMVNRQHIRSEEDFSCAKIFASAFEFLDTNGREDDWLLQIECFDPHEPFHAPERFRKDYPTAYQGTVLDWPLYRRVSDSPEEIAELRANYAALTAMCDEYLGQLLDYFDAHGLWNDTALIVTTDHGFLLGEHDWWAKNRMPCYEEIARIPLMMHHPAHSGQAGTRRAALTQTIDIMPTILDMHGVAVPPDVKGLSLCALMQQTEALRDAAIFGFFGAACNITDGRYTYFRYPEIMNAENLYEYTLMPTRMTSRFSVRELADATLVDPFSFTKSVPVLKLPPLANDNEEPLEVQGMTYEDTTTALYDLAEDPGQAAPIDNPGVEHRLAQRMCELLAESDAPRELYTRLGLPLEDTRRTAKK